MKIFKVMSYAKQSGSKLIPVRAEGAVKWSTEAWGELQEGWLQEVGSAESTDVEISKELDKKTVIFWGSSDRVVDQPGSLKKHIVVFGRCRILGLVNNSEGGVPGPFQQQDILSNEFIWDNERTNHS